MAGGLSFTPVQDIIPAPKATVQAKGARNTKATPAQDQPSGTGNNVEITDNDDEWYTSSSSESGQSPPKKNKYTNNEGSIVTIVKPHSEEEERLLPYMPAIFSTDLPPCGPEPQVAYETLNTRLRERWLKHRGRRSISDICEDEREELERQEKRWPVFSLKGPIKDRKPWRREMVFKFELQWIIYFVDEAKKQSLQLMTESEIMDRRKYSAVPKGLKIIIHKGHLLKPWERWNEKKRVKTPAIPDDLLVEDTSDLGTKLRIPAHENIKNESQDDSKLNSLSESSDISIIHRPSFDGAGDDAHLWSQGNHD